MLDKNTMANTKAVTKSYCCPFSQHKTVSTWYTLNYQVPESQNNTQTFYKLK